MRSLFPIRFLIILTVFGLQSGKSTAQYLFSHNDPTLSCDAAASKAAQSVGVPVKILKAIARVESGRTVDGRFIPWPWTINVEGVGTFLSSKSAASRQIKASYRQGSSSIDAGCFQINLKWHGHRFTSVEQVLDPETNATYAAQFLRSLHLEFGSWDSAVGAYHSRKKEFSDPYLNRYRAVLAKLNDQNAVGEDTPQPASVNAFPLLQGRSNSVARGSLFPQSSRANHSLFTSSKARG